MTTSSLLPRIEPLVRELPGGRRIECLASDEVPLDRAEAWRRPALDGDSLAFLQYTSGSTSAPRGVRISHRNLLENEREIHRAFGMSETSVVVGWLPLFHDMGLIGNVLQPIYAGARCVLMSPTSFLRSPRRWLEAIDRYRGTVSGGPDFAYEHCLRTVTPERRRGLDLGSWRVAFNGSEPVRAATLERFSEAFADCGFHREAFLPCYGLAEATLFVAGTEHGGEKLTAGFQARALALHRAEVSDGEDARILVSCGPPRGVARLEIVDHESRRVAGTGEIGEIWLSGPGVAGGYWGRVRDTAETFYAELAGGGVGERFLRTGDLGFLHRGELYVTGRLKDLIIIRGRNYYPQDIERIAEASHPALRPASSAAFGVEHDGGERLAVVVERQPGRRETITEIAGEVRRAIAEDLEIQVETVALVPAGTVPKTSSGKVRRSACRELFEHEKLEPLGVDTLARTAAPGAGEEPGASAGRPTRELPAGGDGEEIPLSFAHLRQIAAEVLRTDPRRLDSEQPLLYSGLDSLAAVEFRNAVEAATGVALSLTELLDGASLAQVADRLSATRESGAETVEPRAAAPTGEVAEVPLSYMQRALWVTQQLAPENPAYNVPFAARLGPGVDPGALERAFAALVERHSALRTTLVLRGGEPVQRVHSDLAPAFEMRRVAGGYETAYADLVAEAHRPFDLERGPLARFTVWETEGGDRLLLLVVHHLAIDGWSLWLLLDELRELYAAAAARRAAELPPAPAYADFVRWQEELLSSPEGERLERFWRERLAGGVLALDLVRDRPRWRGRSWAGATCPVVLDRELTDRLHRLAKEARTTLYTVVLAAYLTLLARYGSLPDAVIGTAVSGRSRARFEGLVGCCFNAVAARADLSDRPSTRRLLGRLRRSMAEALEHQDYPSHLLAERIGSEGRSDRRGFFEAMFLYQKAHRLADAVTPSPSGWRLDLGGLELEVLFVEQRSARTDLELELVEAGGQVTGWFRYSTDVFSDATVGQMAAHLGRLLAGMADDPETPVTDLPLADAEETRRLRRWGRSDDGGEGWAGNGGARADLLVARQAAQTPEKVAATCGGRSMTYRELDRRADRLAALLRSLHS